MSLSPFFLSFRLCFSSGVANLLKESYSTNARMSFLPFFIFILSFRLPKKTKTDDSEFLRCLSPLTSCRNVSAIS